MGDEPASARKYGNLGRAHDRMGDHYNKSLQILERIGNQHGAAITYLNLGNL